MSVLRVVDGNTPGVTCQGLAQDLRALYLTAMDQQAREDTGAPGRVEVCPPVRARAPGPPAGGAALRASVRRAAQRAVEALVVPRLVAAVEAGDDGPRGAGWRWAAETLIRLARAEAPTREDAEEEARSGVGVPVVVVIGGAPVGAVEPGGRARVALPGHGERGEPDDASGGTRAPRPL